MKKVILVGIVVIIILIMLISGITLYRINKAHELFGDDYCKEEHYMEVGGCALTDFKCMICGIILTNSNTNVPALCGICATLTGRCNKCGKLEQ